MAPYIIVCSFSCILFYVSSYLRKNGNSGFYFFTFLAITPLVLLAATRLPSVGTDSGTYLWLWDRVSDSQHIDLGLFSEPLFTLLMYVTRSIADNTDFGYEIFFGLISFIVCSLSLSAIIKHSAFKVFSLFCFITLGFYTFHFNGARQAIAVAIFLYSFRFIISKNLVAYFLLCLVGFLFHKTMLICVPMYFLYGKSFNFKQVFTIVFISVFVAFSVNSIVEIASSYDQRYSTYANNDYSGGGLVTVLFNTSLLIWLWLSKRLCFIKDSLYDFSLLMMLVAVCIGWVSVFLSLNPSGIIRLSIYCTQWIIFALPLSVMSYGNKNTRVFLLVSFSIFLVVYFYITTTIFSGLTPYSSNLNLPF